jgi:outer membrane immunogenic protein
MKRAIVLGLGLLAAGAVPALAADMPVKAVRPAPVVAPVAYNWTGIYTASSVGGQWWNIRGDYVLPPPDQHNTRGTRFIYGTHLGAQYQFGNWVLGIEGAYNRGFVPAFTSSSGGSTDCIGITGAPGTNCESRIRSHWTFGGKAGYAWDNWMVYGIGGYANGRIETRVVQASTGLVFNQSSERHNGWFVGAGVDVFVTKLWWSDLIVGLEYTHVDLGRVTHTIPIGTPAGINDRSMRATDDVFRFKLTSKFNWAAPAVVAKY